MIQQSEVQSYSIASTSQNLTIILCVYNKAQTAGFLKFFSAIFYWEDVIPAKIVLMTVKGFDFFVGHLFNLTQFKAWLLRLLN